MSEQKRSAYSEKLRDPRWQKRRLEIMQRDQFRCWLCYTETVTLNVHHRWYERGKEPWEASDAALVTLCEKCHQQEYEERPAIEDRILRILRREFLSESLNKIADALHYTRVGRDPYLFAVALDHFLLNDDNVQGMIQAYLSYLDSPESSDQDERYKSDCVRVQK